MPTDIREVIKLARDQNWTVDHTASGHHRFRAPDGVSMVITSLTPSDRRTLANTVGYLRRAGLVIPHAGVKTREETLMTATETPIAMDTLALCEDCLQEDATVADPRMGRRPLAEFVLHHSSGKPLRVCKHHQGARAAAALVERRARRSRLETEAAQEIAPAPLEEIVTEKLPHATALRQEDVDTLLEQITELERRLTSLSTQVEHLASTPQTRLALPDDVATRQVLAFGQRVLQLAKVVEGLVAPETLETLIRSEAGLCVRQLTAH